MTGRPCLWSAVAVTGFLAAGLLVGCGGGGGDGSSGDGLLTADDQLTTEANLRLADFPPEGGWERSPGGDFAAGDEDDRLFARCMGRTPAEEVRTARADSDAFSSPALEQVASTVQVMNTVGIAVGDFDALATPLALSCLQARLDDQLERDTGLVAQQGSSTVTRVTAPAAGDGAAAFRYTYPIPGGPLLIVDNVFARVGRVELSVGFAARGTPVAAGLQADLLGKMVARVKA